MIIQIIAALLLAVFYITHIGKKHQMLAKYSYPFGGVSAYLRMDLRLKISV